MLQYTTHSYYIHVASLFRYQKLRGKIQLQIQSMCVNVCCKLYVYVQCHVINVSKLDHLLAYIYMHKLCSIIHGIVHYTKGLYWRFTSP